MCSLVLKNVEVATKKNGEIINFDLPLSCEFEKLSFEKEFYKERYMYVYCTCIAYFTLYREPLIHFNCSSTKFNSLLINGKKQ